MGFDERKWHTFKKKKYTHDLLKELIFKFIDLALEAAEHQTDYPSWVVFLLKEGYNPASVRVAIKNDPELKEMYEEVMKALPELKVKAARVKGKDGEVIMPWQLVRLDLATNFGWTERAERKIVGDEDKPLKIEIERKIIGGEKRD